MNYKIIPLIVLIPMLQSFSKPEGKDSKPNILFLLADDMGYGELGSYGQREIQTPVLDSLAKNGLRFTQFYAGNTVCSPSRASLLTGKNSGHATIRGNAGYFAGNRWDRVPLKNDELNLAEMMKTAGYQTAFIGKWHLDTPDDLSTWAFARGFDYSVQVQWGKGYNEDIHWIDNKRDSMVYNKHKDDCIDAFRTNILLDYLDKKDNSKPFFLFMSYRTPHAREQFIRDTTLYAGKGWPENERVHAARITMLDREIGRVINRLKEKGELENTVVIFTSDNGAHNEGGHNHKFFESTGGLRGYKRDLYEGGIRVPLIVYWKGTVQPGKKSGYVGAFPDLMPTFAELAGIKKPQQTDGISFLPEILGRKQQQHDYLYWEFQLDGSWNKLVDGGFRQAVRKGDWKAVRYGLHSNTELYNLKSDLFETNDQAKKHPELVIEMNHLFDASHTDTEFFPYGGILK